MLVTFPIQIYSTFVYQKSNNSDMAHYYLLLLFIIVMLYINIPWLFVYLLILFILVNALD